MNDQHAHRAAPRGLLILVGPAAVVGQRLAFEKLLIVRRRLVHDDQRNLALQVHSGIVVPVVLGRVNAIAHEHNGRVDRGLGLARLILRDDLGAVSEIDRRALRGHKREFRLVFIGVHREERHLLEIGAVVARGLSPSSANCVAMYSAASSPPRVPGPRPSSRSRERKRTCARIFSGSMDAAASRAAAGNPATAGTFAACCA